MCTTCRCNGDTQEHGEPVSERTRHWADAVIGTWTITHLGAGGAAAVMGAWIPAALLLGSGACAAAFFWWLPEPLCWIESVATITLIELGIAASLLV